MTKATLQQAEKQSSQFVTKFEATVEERKCELYRVIDEKAQDL